MHFFAFYWTDCGSIGIFIPENMQKDTIRVFKMAAAAILDFWNFNFLTVGTVKRVELHQHAKLRQNRLYRGRYMAIFRFFKMAAAAILDLWNFKFLTVGTFKRFEKHHVAKFHQNRLNCGRDMATWIAILDLASLLKTLKGDKMSPGRFSLYMY